MSRRALKIVILGPPGSGKGTQGEALASRFTIPRLSVGAMLRKQLKLQTKAGLAAGGFLVKGKAVPGSILMPLLGSWLEEQKKGFVIDNLIRTTEQLSAFKDYQEKSSLTFTHVFCLCVTKRNALKRLGVRRHGRAVRHDETEEAINMRFQTYNDSIADISKYFDGLGIYHKINGNKGVEEVFSEILSYIKS